MKKLLLAGFLFSVAIVSCKKKDTSGTPDPTDSTKTVSKFTILTTDKWKVTSIIMKNATDTIVDYYSTLKDCEKDNFIIFNTTGSITSLEGATKCDPSVADTTTDGSWVLNSDTTAFTLKDSKVLPLSGATTAKIVLLNSTNFNISKDTTITYPGLGSISGTIYANFTKVK